MKRARKILDEQRYAITDQGDLRVLSARGEVWEYSATFDDTTSPTRCRTLQQKSRPWKVGTSTSQDCEKSRQEQLLLLTELRSRERAHQETLSYMSDEVEVLRKTRRSEAKLLEEAYQDAVSHEGRKHFGD